MAKAAAAAAMAQQQRARAHSRAEAGGPPPLPGGAAPARTASSAGRPEAARALSGAGQPAASPRGPPPPAPARPPPHARPPPVPAAALPKTQPQPASPPAQRAAAGRPPTPPSAGGGLQVGSLVDSAQFVNGMPNSDPTQVMLVFFKKHKPGSDTLEHVGQVMAAAQAATAASGKPGDWLELLYAGMSRTYDEDPRVAFAEYINMQASAALAATRAAAAKRGWSRAGDMMSTSKRMILAAKQAQDADVSSGESGSSEGGSDSASGDSDEGELGLQDRIDDALEADFDDVRKIEAIVKEASQQDNRHPALVPVKDKLERLKVAQKKDRKGAAAAAVVSEEKEQEERVARQALLESQAAASVEREQALVAELDLHKAELAAAQCLTQQKLAAEEAEASYWKAETAEAKAEKARLEHILAEVQSSFIEQVEAEVAEVLQSTGGSGSPREEQQEALLEEAAEREQRLLEQLERTATELEIVEAKLKGDAPTRGASPPAVASPEMWLIDGGSDASSVDDEEAEFLREEGLESPVEEEEIVRFSTPHSPEPEPEPEQASVQVRAARSLAEILAEPHVASVAPLHIPSVAYRSEPDSEEPISPESRCDLSLFWLMLSPLITFCMDSSLVKIGTDGWTCSWPALTLCSRS